MTAIRSVTLTFSPAKPHRDNHHKSTTLDLITGSNYKISTELCFNLQSLSVALEKLTSLTFHPVQP